MANLIALNSSEDIYYDGETIKTTKGRDTGITLEDLGLNQGWSLLSNYYNPGTAVSRYDLEPVELSEGYAQTEHYDNDFKMTIRLNPLDYKTATLDVKCPFCGALNTIGDKRCRKCKEISPDYIKENLR